jgi:VanZ family protein
MAKVYTLIKRWGLFLLVIFVIFVFSSIPKYTLPDLAQNDFTLKKGGHILGYFLLTLTLWNGLRWEKKKWWLVWIVALLYAISDEFHQSFVPGRNPSLEDVAIDSFAAGLGIFIGYVMIKIKNNRKIIN